MMTEDVKRTLQASIWDGAFYSLMIGLGETYLAAFALALGMGEVATGQLTVVPVLIGAVLQFVGQRGVYWLRSRRKWVVVCAGAQAVALSGVAVLGMMRSLRPEWLFLLASIYWSAGLSAGPAWNAWISTVVPRDLRLRFFSQRNRVIQLFTLAGLMSSGVVLYFAKGSTYYIEVFSALFILAAFCRGISLWFLSRQGDSVALQKETKVSWQARFSILKSNRTSLFLAFLFLMNFAVHWSAPYFTPYMLKQLNLDYLSYMVLVSVAFLARIVSYPFLERIAEKRGIGILMIIGCLGVMPSPALWVVSDRFAYLMVLQAYSGVCWGAWELGVALAIFERHNTADLAKFYSIVNFLNALGMVIGSALAATLFASGAPVVADYHRVFLSSTCVRIIPLLILPWIYRAQSSTHKHQGASGRQSDDEPAAAS